VLTRVLFRPQIPQVAAMEQKTVHCSKKIIRMEQKHFAPNFRNCFRTTKKPCFCFIVAKKWFDAKKDCYDMDLAGGLAGDAGDLDGDLEAEKLPYCSKIDFVEITGDSRSKTLYYCSKITLQM
jgi:hypothetical protein